VPPVIVTSILPLAVPPVIVTSILPLASQVTLFPAKLIATELLLLDPTTTFLEIKQPFASVNTTV